METTRHFTATVYVVADGAVALHEHDRLGLTLPPGGHVDRGELPHETGLREAREEMGVEPTLLDDTEDVGAPNGETLPQPRRMMCYDVDVRADGSVAHQHVDHVYYATADSRDIDPDDGEAPASAWDWYAPADLRASDLEPDTVAFSLDAIEVAGRTRR